MTYKKLYRTIHDNEHADLLQKIAIFALGLIICILIVVVTSRVVKRKRKRKQKHINFNGKRMSIISVWDNGSGFYSELLFKLNHYLYSKKYLLNVTTVAVNWPYTYSNGWTDYFEDTNLSYLLDDKDTIDAKDANRSITIRGCCMVLEQFPLGDYRNIISEYYKYNSKTRIHINNITNNLGLHVGEYGAVYIRRGDKLVDEITIVPAADFAKLLLKKMPECNTIFVQTDDYNCYIDIKNYIENELHSNIKILTICPDTNFGAIAHNGWADRLKKDNIFMNNKNYVQNIKHKLAKPISEMTPDERYVHTMELLTGVDICIHAANVVCDYKSNVSRFIKIAHHNFNAVFDVNGVNVKITDKLCPGFDFNSKKQTMIYKIPTGEYFKKN